MNSKVTIGPGVAPRLEGSIDRQLNFKLASLSASLRSVHATLSTLPREVNPRGKVEYLCKISARVTNGASYEVENIGPEPHMCVADAASRLARTITRAVQLDDVKLGR